MAEGDISSQTWRQPQRDPGESRSGAGYGARFRPDRDCAALVRRFDPMVETFKSVDKGIGTRCRKKWNFRETRLRLIGRYDFGRDREPLHDAPLERTQFHLVEK